MPKVVPKLYRKVDSYDEVEVVQVEVFHSEAGICILRPLNG
jgi:tRNA(Ser,Leu) C12 N-acetylase TAN1